jgi:hypothetical protein
MKLRVIFFCCLVSSFAFGQDIDNDAASWVTANLEKRLSEKFILRAGEQFRLNNNFKDAGQFTTNVGLTYKLASGIRLAGDYAFRQRRRLDGSYSLRHQFFASATWRHDFKRLRISYRARFQAQYRDWLSSENGNQAQWHHRHKLTLRREMTKRIDAYVAAEAYFPLLRANRPTMDRHRLFTGLIYNLSKKTSLEGYFLLQLNHTYTNQPRRDFVYGITLSHEL